MFKGATRIIKTLAGQAPVAVVAANQTNPAQKQSRAAFHESGVHGSNLTNRARTSLQDELAVPRPVSGQKAG